MDGKPEIKQEQGPRKQYRPKDDDHTELDFSNANDKVWLVKLPKFLFDKWVGSAPGTELGHLKMNEANRKEMKVVLSDEIVQDSKSDMEEEPRPVANDIPKEYSLEMQNQTVTNTYIFSEPAAKPWAERPSRSNTPAPDVEEEEVDTKGASPNAIGADVPERRRAGGPDRSRKNLGGQVLGGKVVHDCLVKPIDNALYRTLLRDRVSVADGPKRKIQIVYDATLSGNLMAPGSIVSIAPTGQTKSFIKSKPKLKSREIHARMSLDNLLDEIVKCFKQYEYWSLKAFKAHLKQPESYLKETLENIAMLHKRGPMTGKWQLKAETRNAMKGYAGLSQFDKSSTQKALADRDQDDQKIKSEHQGEAAPEVDDSDDDIEMEDRL